MLTRIFPTRFDNDYRGSGLAVWLLVPLVLMKLVMGVNVMIHTRDIIQNVDGFPLSSFSTEAQAALVFSFQAWALGLFLMAALSLVACARYRTMVPLIYLLLLLENGGRKLIGLLSAEPLTASTVAAPSLGSLINLGLIAALVVGFALSLMVRGADRAAAAS